MFIVIDGNDGSGKGTQTKKLEERLVQTKHNYAFYDFPTYEKSKLGYLVGDYLAGKYGAMADVPVELASLFYTIDRYQLKDQMFRDLKDGKVIICNRFTPSNMAYQGAKLKGRERNELVKWIEATESRLPKPDVVVFLDMPADVVQQLVDKKGHRNYLGGQKRDIHESSRTYLEEVGQFYRELAEKHGWMHIKCATKKGDEWVIRSIDDIHEEIWDKIKDKL